jgi:NAD-dependent deacetylase
VAGVRHHRGVRIVFLTGAGISAESGLPTFRDADGLWEGYRPEEVATPEAFEADPQLVQRFYDARRAALATVEPNAAHHALVRLEERLGDDFLLVTQNIDDLHQRAGSRRIVPMHGRLRSSYCRHCGERSHWTGTLADGPPCPACGVAALRPDVVWFGEVPHGLDRIAQAVERADLFVSVGTSGAVYPAAGRAAAAHAAGARTLELNLVPSEGVTAFDEARHGPATELVPIWVDEVVSRLPR